MEPGKGATPKEMPGTSVDLERAKQTDDAGTTQSSRGQMVATGNVGRIHQAIRNSSTEGDEYNDMIMMSNNRVNWKDFLEAAPLSITLLGQLMVLASTKDFKLPASKSKELKHSESFRGSLVQISNRGWEAFNEAHTNMHQIQISSTNVQRHVKFALGIIRKGTQADVKYLLPKPLKSIETIANDCLTLSSATEKKFVDVMGLIGDVLKSCTEAKGQYEKDSQNTKAAIQVAEANKVFAEKEHEENNKQLAEMEKKLNEAKEVYKTAMKEMPSATKLILANVMDNLGGGFLSGLSKLLSKSGAPPASADSAGKSKPEDTEHPISIEDRNIYKFAERLNNLCTDLAALVKKPDETDQEEKEDQAHVEKPHDSGRKEEKNLIVLRETAKSLQKKISEKGECQPKKDALHLCQEAILLCDSLTKLNHTLEAQTSDDRKKVFEKNSKSAQDMMNSCKAFLSASTANSKSNHSKKNTPHTPKATANTSGSSQDAIINTWQAKLRSAEEQLNNAQQRVDEAQRQSRETSKPIYEEILKISQCNLEKINFDEIVKTLIEGIHALSEVREQWGKLVKFFHEISNIIKCTLNTSVKEFSESVTVGSNMILEYDIKISDFLLDTIYMQAYRASTVAHVIHHVSSMYMEVSNTAIMDTLASLPKLLVLKNASETSTATNMEKLMSNCKETQKEIREMVAKKQKEFESAISDQINHIKCELAAVLPDDGEDNDIATENIPSVEHEHQEGGPSQASIEN